MPLNSSRSSLQASKWCCPPLTLRGCPGAEIVHPKARTVTISTYTVAPRTSRGPTWFPTRVPSRMVDTV